MNFLDINGLTYFYNKIKEKFISSINNINPDISGNIELNANNILATDNNSVQDHINELEDYYKIIRVDINGNGDFTTISEAITAANDDDIILVYPGTYFESVHAYNKLVHIKGIDKKTCILEYHGKDYANPPLEMAKGSVENLTIIARNSGTAGNANAYCVHIDNNNEAEQSLSFKNVSFINEIHQAVGIGLRHNFDLRFENCEFEAINQAALYCHDWETSDTTADKSGQKLTVLNCTLRNNDATHATIMLQSQELATDCATCEFVGCAVYNANASGKKISMTKWQGRTLTNTSFMGSSDWVLLKNSALNTVTELNATPYPISQKDLFFYSNVHYHVLNSNQPFVTNLGRYKGGLALCNFQGVGFTILYLYHGNNNVATAQNVVHGSAFTSEYYSFVANDNDGTLTISTTLATNSPILLFTPEAY